MTQSHWTNSGFKRTIKEAGFLISAAVALIVGAVGIIAWSDGHNDERYASRADGAVMLEKISNIEKQNEQIMNLLQELLQQGRRGE